MAGKLADEAGPAAAKVWLFSTDVAEDEGPFTCVPGSHRLTKHRLAWERRLARGATRDPDRLAGRGSFRATPKRPRRPGYGEPVAFAVPGNTLVVGGTVGFHARGPSLRPSVRIEVWAFDRQPVPALGRDRSVVGAGLGALAQAA